MALPTLTCPSCMHPLDGQKCNTETFEPCEQCKKKTRFDVFPALLRPIAGGTTGQAIVVDGEASCFFHPQKRASAHCDACGRFLCALCDLDFQSQHLCPSCLDSGQKKQKWNDLEQKRFLYDSSAMAMAILPIIFWPVLVITAPFTLGMIVYGWNKPGSLVPRTKWRFIVAGIIALLEILGIVLFIIMIVKESSASS